MDRPRRSVNNTVYREAIDEIRQFNANESREIQRGRRVEVCLYQNVFILFLLTYNM
jgi:hypothetical protein